MRKTEIFVLVAGFCLTISLGISNWVASTNSVRNCQSTEFIKRAMVLELKNDAKLWASLTYYKDNPDELKIALRDNEILIKKYLSEIHQCGGLLRE